MMGSPTQTALINIKNKLTESLHIAVRELNSCSCDMPECSTCGIINGMKATMYDLDKALAEEQENILEKMKGGINL